MKSSILFFLFSISLYAQIQVNKLNPEKVSDNFYQFRSSSADVGVKYFSRNGDIQAYSYDFEDRINIIIEYIEEPYLVKKFIKGENVSPNDYLSSGIRLKNDLSQIAAAKSSRLNKTNIHLEVKKEFYKLFNGAAVSISPEIIKEITDLPYVKKIHMDHQVQANLNESVAIIGADSLWEKYNIKGRSILVAVLDTGIDYMHPYLGGGFGPGFRVKGGYDFINDDNDPMDDNFHGTHVAGIIGANSDSIKGVAPEVSFLAVKVLDQNGSGPTSGVIEGIEYVIDPNDDGNLDDAADVVNMSLGGPGNPDDAASQAVDNAVKLGIVFCIASGNTGSYFNIGSPGTAREAITVGATDKDDQIAGFSSRGPNSDFTIKPDVVAPGVGILSTFPQNRLDILNGTSMSSPHVAGLAALLLSVNREWTPRQVKSALKTSAVNLNENVMDQGAGRINALGAVEEDLFFYPSDVSFGIADLSEDIWEVEKTLTIYNYLDQFRQYDIFFENTIPGISLTTFPSSIFIEPMDSLKLVVRLSVDNSQVPYPNDRSVTYSGYVEFTSQNDTMSLPWAFLKASQLVITSDLPFPFISLSSKDIFAGSFDAQTEDFLNYTFSVPAGHYDIITVYDISLEEAPKILFNENFYVEGLVKLNLNSTDAKNKLTIESVDEQNRRLYDRGNLYRDIGILFPESSSLSATSFSAFLSSPELFVSDFSNRFKLSIAEYQHDLGSEEKVRILRHKPIEGINNDFTLTNSYDDYIGQKLSFTLPPDQNSGWLYFPYTSRVATIYEDDLFYLSIGAIEHFVNANMWEGEIYISEENPSLRIGATTKINVSPDKNYISTPNNFSTPFIHCFDGKFGFFDGYDDLVYFKEPVVNTLRLGTSPSYANAFFLNNWYSASNIAIDLPFISGMRFLGTFNELKDIESLESVYEILNDNGGVIDSGNLLETKPVEVNPGRYSVKVTNNNYYLNNAKGNSELIGTFDLRQDDPNPPDIISFRILGEDSSIVNSVKAGENSLIEFSIADNELKRTVGFSFEEVYQNLPNDSTELYYKIHGTDQWEQLEFVSIEEFPGTGIRYTAEWENNLSTNSSAIDIKFKAQDYSGNMIECTLEPAFLIGDGIITSVKEEESEQLNVPLTYSLSNNYPNPFNPSTLIKYSIPSDGNVSLKIYNILGEEVFTLVEGMVKAGEHSVNWDASKFSSGIYFYQLRADKFHETKKMLLIK